MNAVPISVLAAAIRPLLRVDGDHLLWDGPVHPTLPVIRVAGDWHSVRRVWWQAGGRTVHDGYKVRNECGIARCVALPHQWAGWAGALQDGLSLDAAWSWTDADILGRVADQLTRDGAHWRWQGPLNKGRPVAKIYRHGWVRWFPLHRVAWRAADRPLRRADHLLSTCDDLTCIAPDHHQRVERGNQARVPRPAPGPSRPLVRRSPWALEPIATAREVFDLDPFRWIVWPAPPAAELRPCIACGMPALTRPGYVPHCLQHDAEQYAPLGAMALRDRVQGQVR